MRPFTYKKPADIKGALSSFGHQTQYIAGGTNLVDLMKKFVSTPEHLIDVQGALSSDISLSAEGLKMGALAKNSAISVHPQVLSDFPLISKAILAGASPQIRNMATLGGNLLQRTRCPYFYDLSTPCNKREKGTGCSAKEGVQRMSAVIGYSDDCIAVHPSDLCVALVALDAQVGITSKAGKEGKVLFRDFHKLPGDTPHVDNHLPEGALITYVEVPKNNFAEHCAYVKLRDRTSYAFALVSVAAALELKDGKIVNARLASGGVAHKPWRWFSAEKALVGKVANEETFEKAAAMIQKEIKPLEGNAFKSELLYGAVQSALKQCL
ncbi:molybdopterin dehydrogenase FAD-binding protein [Leadbetterella byssophila DSM 17132]|uniref:Molybdopterin dehydrogenase FAD-binding protein n=1 Tax=Leadbetterella byssophila (strain DSM 17132 / JCM 16389 / KACC 11308 / NBRC 106382 / 4M15) TaxID=649349 RepID=E4RVD8_LEAB4|nr:xanthine dehydrogenase family protein subunit M [Leadbetterella byssophila]ADQ16124.1 molybdopterin dehydrogenase FAD-binding protein [Leadbetterella byssophila DSM 17132]